MRTLSLCQLHVIKRYASLLRWTSHDTFHHNLKHKHQRHMQQVVEFNSCTVQRDNQLERDKTERDLVLEAHPVRLNSRQERGLSKPPQPTLLSCLRKKQHLLPLLTLLVNVEGPSFFSQHVVPQLHTRSCVCGKKINMPSLNCIQIVRNYICLCSYKPNGPIVLQRQHKGLLYNIPQKKRTMGLF